MERDYGFFEEHLSKFNKIPLIYRFEVVSSLNNGFGAHWHPNIELLYFIEGSADVLINSTYYAVHAGDFIIINSNFIHKLISKEAPTKYHCLIIDNNFCSQFFLDYTESLFRPMIRSDQCQNIMQEVIYEFLGKPDTYRTDNLKDLTLLLIRNLFRYNKVDDDTNFLKESSKISLVKSIIDYIKKNYSQPINIDSMCSVVCISKYYLCRTFKSVTGQTINNYIVDFRCQKAKILLNNSNSPIKEISYLCGFHDAAYFTKCYKKVFGYIPSHERQPV
ncbi:helix-turn-helix domain-containing protein [Anaerocolumna xylanovorans]|uniref:Transcriptional regulator, AraC family n=1 Tax=Anaerocolumna xylanovorans DSM 12503 TaxID=1121345 RepID=A0A1M7Y575_9FIRM|nr:AraC family transcriptional regulator [Anaerocolumna xylanovorans]SHO47574.1 transcriptional regulator, AraC family [Anaerocolumna xylanovorans DSM 12503]